MKLVALLLPAFTAITVSSAPAAVYTITAAADAFVRAAAPDSNYGKAGLLSVSGTTATGSGGGVNGAYDVFLRFATVATRAQLDTDFGAGLWRITAASLTLTEVTNPGNAIFNLGAGQSQVQWIGGDGWDEGTGSPNAPGLTGITWNTRGSFLSPAADRNLGVFANPQTGGTLTASLTLDNSFLTDLTTDTLTTLYLTAATASTGFNFRSRDFVGDPSVLPHLNLTVEAIPEPSTAGLCLVASATLRRRRTKRFPVSIF